MIRAIVSSERDPDDRKRWLYTLRCGHTVSRRMNAVKRQCFCGYCALCE